MAGAPSTSANNCDIAVNNGHTGHSAATPLSVRQQSNAICHIIGELYNFQRRHLITFKLNAQIVNAEQLIWKAQTSGQCTLLPAMAKKEDNMHYNWWMWLTTI
eukprot:5302663-Amphidinium_carterae.1